MRYRAVSMTYRNEGLGTIERARSVGEVVVVTERIAVDGIRFADWAEPYRYEIDRRTGTGRWRYGAREGMLKGCSWNEASLTLTGCHIEAPRGKDWFTIEADEPE
jgi:hypothetical protein